MSDIDRRDFLKAAGVAGLGLGIVPDRLHALGRAAAQEPSGRLFAAPPIATVRMGFVGVGHQGLAHVRNFLGIEGVEVRAVCDIVPAKVQRVQVMVE